MILGKIRTIVIGIFRRDDQLLVCEGFDKVKKNYYYRPPGGSIEFGERAEDALKREIQEELGAEIDIWLFRGSLENIFVCDGMPGHEIVLIYEAKFRDSNFYQRNELSAVEDNGEVFKAVWKGKNDFDADHRLVPEGIERFLQP
jgi:8-oxo-dGTP pyrophosphatase MutT (NUDIX family)